MEEQVLNASTFVMECTADMLGPKRDNLAVVIPISIVYAVIFFTGTIGNISTCIVIFRNKSMHTATNYYLFNLAVSDLLLLLSAVPYEVYTIYHRYPYVLGGVFCFLRGMFAETFANATVLTITAFTVERYLAICHPFLSHTMSKLSRAVKLILAIWLVAVSLAVPQAMQFEVIGEGDCKRCDFVNPIIEHSFELSTLLFFVMPMMLITILYVLIGQRLKSSNMMKRRNNNARIQSKSSRKVVKMLVAVVVAFFVCWAPFHTQRVYTSLIMYQSGTIEPHYRQIYDIVTYISGILYYMSATINPILYNIMSVKFREAFKETFARCCGLGHSSRPQRSYSVLSRSAQRGPDSTDSGRDDPTLHTHTTITQKSSLESVNGINSNSKRIRTVSTTVRSDGIEEEDPLPTIDWTKESSDTLKSTSEVSSPNSRFIAIRLGQPAAPKLNKFWQYFECLAKKTLDDGKRLSAYYASPAKEPATLVELEATPKNARGRCTSPCDISNSSLKDVENGAIEDELTSYMKEIRRREYCS